MLKRAVVNTEKAISTARIFWGLALIIYSASQWQHYGIYCAAVSMIPMAFFVMASGFFLRILRNGKLPRWLTFVSVTMDCMVAALSLLPNILWPYDTYTGITSAIDVSGLMICLFAAGFRLSTRVAAWGSVLSLINYFSLITIDYVTNGFPKDNGFEGAILFFVYLLGCAALTVILARHTRLLVKKSAQEAAQNVFAKQALTSIMQGHHDMKSMLTSATIGVEILSDRLRNHSTTGASVDNRNESSSMVQKLSSDLLRLNSAVHAIKNEAFGRLTNLQGSQSVEIKDAYDSVVSRISKDYEYVQFIQDFSNAQSVQINGGTPALERILFNLMMNACEGDGNIGACHIKVNARPVSGKHCVEFNIRDDGPGFDAEVLASAENPHPLSRKLGGTGIGLLTVRYLLGDMVSTLQLRNLHADGKQSSGATVSFELCM